MTAGELARFREENAALRDLLAAIPRDKFRFPPKTAG